MADVDYDEIRKRNIAARQAKFAELFKDLKADKDLYTKPKVEKDSSHSSDEDIENQPPKKRRKFRRTNYSPEVKRTYNTRNRSRRASENGFNNDDVIDRDIEEDNIDGELLRRLVPKGRSLKVIFPWAKTFEREMEISRMDIWDVDKDLAQIEEEYDSDRPARKKRSFIHKVTKSEYDPSSIPSPDEITESMLQNVADKSSGKTYCKYNGTSCHQCRQKTLDTKTVCRSGECIGVRGQFCGPCLRGRYGEDAITVLKDPNWACPPCRGLCNCSICRTRNGQRPTGILAPVAQEEGFSSVMDYLQAEDEEEVPETSD